MKASELTSFEWKQIKFFKPKEFMGSQYREDPYTSMLPFLDVRVVWAIARLRRLCGQAMTPSPVRGAIARTWKPESQHHIGGVREYSMAIDLLVLEGSLKNVYDSAKDMREIGGFGAYPEWKPNHGVHIDIRPHTRQAIWMAEKIKGKQVYLGLNWKRIKELEALRTKSSDV